jgi:hypothetical protein
MTGYRPMTLADLAGRLARTPDVKVRWKLVWEFLEEYRWESTSVQPSLLSDKPAPIGDDRWDTLGSASTGSTCPRATWRLRERVSGNRLGFQLK